MCVASGETEPAWVVLSFGDLGISNVTGEAPAASGIPPPSGPLPGPCAEARHRCGVGKAVDEVRRAAGEAGHQEVGQGGPWGRGPKLHQEDAELRGHTSIAHIRVHPCLHNTCGTPAHTPRGMRGRNGPAPCWVGACSDSKHLSSQISAAKALAYGETSCCRDGQSIKHAEESFADRRVPTGRDHIRRSVMVEVSPCPHQGHLAWARFHQPWTWAGSSGGSAGWSMWSLPRAGAAPMGPALSPGAGEGSLHFLTRGLQHPAPCGAE